MALIVWIAIIVIVGLAAKTLLSKSTARNAFDWNRQHTFFVTGAASGIGKRVTEVLLEKNQRVVATDIAHDQLVTLHKSHPNLLLLKLDVTDHSMWETCYAQAVEKFNTIDVHMNIAGYLKPGYVLDITMQDVSRHIDINTKGVIYGTHYAAKHMKQNRHGHIVNIASMAALCPIAGLGLYSASKYACRAFTLLSAAELKPHGIKATAVCPDAVQTPMLTLQLDHQEASRTFSGDALLTADDVVSVLLGTVLSEQPLEVWIPFSRGALAKFGDIIFGSTLFRILDDQVLAKGDKKRQELKKTC